MFRFLINFHAALLFPYKNKVYRLKIHFQRYKNYSLLHFSSLQIVFPSFNHVVSSEHILHLQTNMVRTEKCFGTETSVDALLSDNVFNKRYKHDIKCPNLANLFESYLEGGITEVWRQQIKLTPKFNLLRMTKSHTRSFIRP